MARDTSKPGAQDWRQLATAGAITVGVVGTLILGAALRADPPETPPRTLAELQSPPTPDVAAPVETTIPQSAPPLDQPPPPEPPAQPPVARTASPPAARPSLSPPAEGRWTLQFMVTCTPETVERLKGELGDDPRLQLLPMEMDGRRCHRVCWGAYATRDEAVAPQRFPAALSAISAEPIPRQVTDLLR